MFVVLTLLVLTQAPAGEAPSIAIPTWATVEVKPELAAFLSDHVAGVLRADGLKVITSTEMASLLSMERQKQLLGCSDGASSCMTELANALGCSALLLVNLARLEDTYRGNLKVLRATDGLVLAETRVAAKGQNALVDELEAAAHRLGAGLQAKAVASEVTAGGARQWWWAPALGGGLVAAGGVASLVGAQLTYTGLERTLRSNRAVSDADVVTARRGETLQTAGWVGVGVGAAALAGAAAMYFFGGDAPTVTPTVSISPTSASVGVVGVLP